jgi:DNA-binding transcriptional LysR family regulator
VRLLQRTTRKLSLTDAGEQYHRHCVAMREQADAAEEAVAVVHGEARGTIRVTCPVTIAQISVGPALPAFLRKHPQLRVEMQVTNRVVDLVQEGVDVAVRVRPTLEDSGSLVVKQLSRTYGWLLASPDLLEREGRPQVVEDLARLSTVAMSSADGRASWRLQGPGGREFEWQGSTWCSRPWASRCCPTTCARATSAKGGWSRCCRVGRRRRPSCTRCFPRAAAWCPRCGASSISSARP